MRLWASSGDIVVTSSVRTVTVPPSRWSVGHDVSVHQVDALGRTRLGAFLGEFFEMLGDLRLAGFAARIVEDFAAGADIGEEVVADFEEHRRFLFAQAAVLALA